VTPVQVQTETVLCPKCGSQNLPHAYFCTTCHAILIRRCPNCWHEQRQGDVCEECGTNFTLASELALERALEAQGRVTRDKSIGTASAFVQILILPFVSLGGLLRSLVVRLMGTYLFRR
jgi:uncharacterized membrane protein YvbJ